MGEALISRAGGGEAEAILPVVPGYHTILINLKDYENKPLSNFYVNCKDGSSWYNYTTNEKGQALFTTNSGSANFTVFNRKYIDFVNTSINVDAPLSQSSKKDIILNKASTVYITSTSNVKFLLPQINLNTVLCGGGGGGGGGGEIDFEPDYAGRGGHGYTKSVKFSADSNTNIYCYIGLGGSGGKSESDSWPSSEGGVGGTGGTTTLNGQYSANGGKGGRGGGTGDGQDGSGGSGLDGYGRGGSGGWGSDQAGSSGGSGCIKFIFA